MHCTNNASLPSSPWGTRLALCCVTAVLAACGGGEPEDRPFAASLDPTSLALTASLHAYCDVTTPIQAPQAGQSGYDYAPWNTWTNNGQSELSGSVYAWGQAEVSTIGELQLQTNYRDYSDVIGKVLTASGVVDASGMGVTLFDMLPDQAVGCVRSVAHPVFTPWTGSLVPRPVVSMSWSGRTTGELSMADLPGTPKNGFEFAANFSMPPEWGFVYFNVPRSALADPAAARVCRRTAENAQWECQHPTALDGGAYWSLRLPGAKPGVYVLM